MLNIVTGVEKTPIKICIYGAEGVGKTSLAANMPEPLFIDTEGGTSRLNVRRIKCAAWDELDLEIAERQARIDEISKAVSVMVKENARTVQDQIEFARRYDNLTKQYEEHKATLDKAVKEKAYKTGKATQMRASLEAMKKADDFLEEWSDEVWILMVESATVNRDNTITFTFISGQEVRV